MSCRGFLQCVLKILNFFLTLVGAGIVLYSLWMLDQWYRHTPAPAPAPVPDELYASPGVVALKGLPSILPQPIQMVDGQEIQMVSTLSFVMGQGTKLNALVVLPAPWFIYGFLGFGVIACIVTCAGHIAAETASSCCLCFYTTFLGLLLILQAAIGATIFFDRNWREAIPDDPTGELDRMYAFFAENFEVFKWVGLAILIIEALSLLLSLILRAVTDSRKSGYDSDDDYLPRTQRQPAQRQAAPAGNGAPSDAPAESRPAARSDEWSKRMREKYGLDTNEFTYNPSESRRFPQQGGAASSTGEEKKSRCSIM